MTIRNFRNKLIVMLSAAILAIGSVSHAQGVDALASEIDRQADVIFTEMKVQQPDFELSSMRRAQRAATYKLKQMHVLSDVLKACGPAPATALIATEVLTNFIIAPLLAAKGNPVGAAISASVPWGVFAALGIASYDVMKLRIKIARDLKIPSLRELDRIRKVVVGYDIKHRVSSAIYHSTVEVFTGQTQFDVVRRRIDGDASQTPFMTITELENLIRTEAQGAIYLDQIYLERVDKELYVALMLRYMDEAPDLTERLLEILQARTPVIAQKNPGLRQHLIAVDDLRKQIARDLKKIQGTTKGLKKLVKAGTMTKDEAKVEKSRLGQETKRIQDARNLVARHEYAMLHAINDSYKLGDSAAVDRIAHDFENSLAALRNNSRFLVTPVPLAPSIVNPVPKPLEILSLGPTAKPVRSCSSLFVSFAK